MKSGLTKKCECGSKRPPLPSWYENSEKLSSLISILLKVPVWEQAIHTKLWRENFPYYLNYIVIRGLDVDPSHLLLLGACGSTAGLTRMV